MFDEASNIQMRGNLNVFVNVCLYSGDVKTLSLALQGINIILRHILFKSCHINVTVLIILTTVYSFLLNLRKIQNYPTEHQRQYTGNCCLSYINIMYLWTKL